MNYWKIRTNGNVGGKKDVDNLKKENKLTLSIVHNRNIF